jgi:hypothetical protein
MARTLYVSVPAVDQLPVYEPDGFQKKSGLPSGDFSVIVFRDGNLHATSVAVAEIGATGEYRVEWTPPLTGFWLLEVRNAYNYEVWFNEYDIVKPTLLGIA